MTQLRAVECSSPSFSHLLHVGSDCGAFFCTWRGYFLDETKSEDLFEVQQQSLKGTERSQSMRDLQHMQVPQQIPSAHAPSECSQTTETTCVLRLLQPLKRLKVLRSVTSSHRCPELRTKGIPLYYTKTSYGSIIIFLPSTAVSISAAFLNCLSHLPFFFFSY